MALYHVNPKTGTPTLCRAKVKCPFGDRSKHYPTETEAQAAYEESMNTHTMKSYSAAKSRKEKPTSLSSLMDLEALQRLRKEGFVQEQVHPEDPALKVLTYSNLTQIQGKWNEVTKQTRGLIIRSEEADYSDAVVVERPWRKFYTLQQMESGWSLGDEEEGAASAANNELENLDFDAPAEVTDKADGSLGILYQAPDGKLAFSTKGSFASEQALMYTKMLREDPKFYEAAEKLKKEHPQTTFLFELVGIDNQIVLEYDEDDITFLGAVDKDTGKYRSTQEYSSTWASEKGLTSAETMSAKTLREALAIPNRPNREGVVVRIMSDDPQKQMQVKIKQDDYLALHRMMTGFTKRGAREVLRESNITVDQLLAIAKTQDVHQSPEVGDVLDTIGRSRSRFFERMYEKNLDDFNRAVLPVANSVASAKAKVDALPQSMFEGSASEAKRNFAKMIAEAPKEEKSALFNFFEIRYNGEDYREAFPMWKLRATMARGI